MGPELGFRGRLLRPTGALAKKPAYPAGRADLSTWLHEAEQGRVWQASRFLPPSRADDDENQLILLRRFEDLGASWRSGNVLKPQ